MFAGLTGWHLLIILAVILLLFGATKLPALSKSVGQSMRIFKSEVKTMKEEDDKDGKGAVTSEATIDAQKAPVAESPSQPKP
jgi:sec-independent protein translocase protein TatA